MKKILAIIMAICMMATMLCVPAFAAEETLPEPAAGTVLRVSAIQGDDTVLIGDYNNFEDGWNAAMGIAGNSGKMKEKAYDRIVVDIYTDWNAVNGEFTDDWSNGAGFDNDTIYIPADAKVTLNLRDHTINRGLTKDQNDGEVMFINDDADVIINNGTITGGYSNSEGGGLYIEGGANVTLNDVNVIGNAVKGDDGSGIYIYGGATLIMNGCSLSNNVLDEKHLGIDIIEPFGTLCAMDATVILNNVTIDGNYTLTNQAEGVVLYAKRSVVKMNQCTVSNNLAKGSEALHAIYVEDSSLTITDTNFANNNTVPLSSVYSYSLFLFCVKDSNLIVTGGAITQNGGSDIFYLDDTEADITDVTITDNACDVIELKNNNKVVNMISCTFGNNTYPKSDATFSMRHQGTLILLDCILGDSTFSNTEYVKITTSEVTREEAVIGIELLREDGTVDSVRYYKDFASGWDYAVECAETNFFDHIVINLYTDWNSHKYGAITIPENARVTLNLNGHTIDRGLGNNNEYNGEVICINEDADVIINGGKSGDPIVEAGKDPGEIEMGTITGGNSDNGAGGIHVKDGAKLTLNNVHVDDNISDDDNGAGIAIYEGASLVMNGGSLSHNSLVGSTLGSDSYQGGGLYVYKGTAILDNVEIKNNQAYNDEGAGMAVYAYESEVALSNCIIDGNGLKTNADNSYPGYATIYVNKSELTVTKTRFTNNGTYVYHSGARDYIFSTVIGGRRTSNVKLDECVFENNNVACIFYFTNGADSAQLNATKCEIVNNKSSVHSWTQGTLVFEKCTFNNNKSQNGDEAFDNNGYQTIILRDCSMGDSDYRDKTDIIFEDSNGNKLSASIFGEGSLTMIVSFVALIASVAALVVNVSSKKKAASATANNTTESEDEE